VTGKVNLRDLLGSLRHASKGATTPSRLSVTMSSGLARFEGPVRILIAERDRTGQAFLAGWDARDPRLNRCAGADHAYSDDASHEWLLGQILAALANE
jgi:hypothetical protein